MAKIDEKTLQEAVARGIPRSGGYAPPPYTPPQEVEESVEEDYEEPKPRRRATNNAIDDYRDKYFARNEYPSRQLLYVSEELHESLTEVTKGVGGKRATLSSYVENILRSHLTKHKEMLNGVHKRKYKCPIGW